MAKKEIRVDHQRVLRRIRSLGLLRLSLGIALVAGLLTLLIPNVYVSEVRILPASPPTMSSGLAQFNTMATALGVNLPAQDGGEGSYQDILCSRTVLEDLLRAQYTYRKSFSPLFQGRQRQESLMEYLHAKDIDDGVRKMAEVLSSYRDPKTKLLTISVESDSPELSQAIANNAETELEQFLIKNNKTKGHEKAVLSESRLEESRRKLDEAQAELQDFLSANRNFSTSMDPLVKLRGERLEANFRLYQQLIVSLALAHEQALLEEKNDSPILRVMDHANLPVQKSGPSRGKWVVIFFLLAYGFGLAWEHASSLKNLLKIPMMDGEG